MHLWIGVENFAKIESAKINVDNYTVLVGPNNSGKTFLMQLIQGIDGKLVDFLDENDIKLLCSKKEVGYSQFFIDSARLDILVEQINKKLERNKENIIRDIFGRDIAIEKLYIEASLEDNEAYQIDVLDKDGFTNESIKEYANSEISLFYKFVKENKDILVGALSRVENFRIKSFMMVSMGEANDDIFKVKRLLSSLFENNSLFLPASRTGLMLLYRDFFVNKTDDRVLYQWKDEKLLENKEKYGGLTQPIYEFLCFLQTYTSNEDMDNVYEDELRFFEENLIEGHISVSKQGTFAYTTNAEQGSVPMYLASAMINEVAPIILALTSQKMYHRLIIDEVEASLHPKKQLELVRFLNRLNNKKMKLLISTHSDTFVSKLNNLYVLSAYVETEDDDKVLKNFNLKKEDLTNTRNLFVYEFVFQENGKSIVKEIIPDKKSGYQFDLFTSSALELYQESYRIGEIS